MQDCRSSLIESAVVGITTTKLAKAKSSLEIYIPGSARTSFQSSCRVIRAPGPRQPTETPKLRPVGGGGEPWLIASQIPKLFHSCRTGPEPVFKEFSDLLKECR